MRWLPLALVTAVAFGAYHVLLKVGSGRVDPLLGAFVLQLVAAAVGGAALLAWWAAAAEPLAVTRGPRLGRARRAGRRARRDRRVRRVRAGAPVSLGTPVLVGGSVLLATVVGAAVLREPVTGLQLAGAGLVVAGIALLSGG
ncbi:MAG: hypothetical protein R3F59_09000 [Myxococcota bacterium]